MKRDVTPERVENYWKQRNGHKRKSSLWSGVHGATIYEERALVLFRTKRSRSHRQFSNT